MQNTMPIYTEPGACVGVGVGSDWTYVPAWVPDKPVVASAPPYVPPDKTAESPQDGFGGSTKPVYASTPPHYTLVEPARQGYISRNMSSTVSSTVSVLRGAYSRCAAVVQTDPDIANACTSLAQMYRQGVGTVWSVWASVGSYVQRMYGTRPADVCAGLQECYSAGLVRDGIKLYNALARPDK